MSSARTAGAGLSAAGAIMSGLDLLNDPEAQDMRDDALRLIAASSEKLVALLAFDRVAFGASAAAETFDVRELEKLTRATDQLRDRFGFEVVQFGGYFKREDGTRIEVVGIAEQGKYHNLTEDQIREAVMFGHGTGTYREHTPYGPRLEVSGVAADGTPLKAWLEPVDRTDGLWECKTAIPLR